LKLAKLNHCSKPLRALLCGLALISSQPLWAQAAYRCDDNGKVVYQAAPCAGGKAVNAADKPSVDQKAQAQAAAEQERQDAKALARERAARQSSMPKPSGAAGIEGYKTTSMQEREGVVKNKTKRSKAHKKPKATKIMKPKEPKKSPKKPITK
jgi:hypothetical protein